MLQGGLVYLRAHQEVFLHNVQKPRPARVPNLTPMAQWHSGVRVETLYGTESQAGPGNSPLTFPLAEWDNDATSAAEDQEAGRAPLAPGG